MTKTKVVNLRNEKYDVYIGRGSMFGNPFIIGRHGSREEVIELYYTLTKKKIRSNPKFKQHVLNLENKTLGCFCKPKACHGDMLIKLIEMIKKDLL